MARSHSFKSRFASVLLSLAPALVLGQSTPQGVVSCLQSQNVPFSTPQDPTWTDATAAVQQRIPREPVVVVLAEDRDDVAAALSCAQQNSLKVSTVNRANSFQGWGFGNPGNLIINMKNFTEMSYDPSTELVTLGGGANVGPVAKFLNDEHKRSIVHVRGSNVGIYGSTTGVGFGTLSRMYGTPLQNLMSAEIMLANGSIVEAGPGSKLLWGARGSGAGLGVALSYKISTHPIPFDTPLNYTIALGRNLSIETVTSALLIIQEFALDGKIPDEMSVRYQFNTAQTNGYFYGREAAFDEVVTPLVDALRGVAPNVTVTKTIISSYWESEVFVTGPGMNLPDGGGMPSGRYSHVQSWVTTSDKPLTAKQISTAFECHRSSRNRTDVTASGFFDLWAGRKVNVDASEASYILNKNLWIIRVDGTGSNAWPSDGASYMQGLMRPFEKTLEAGDLRTFGNYIDTNLSRGQWSKRLFGRNYPKLQELKAEVDPTETFSGYGLAINLPGSKL